jgi:hypothetical protein
VLESTVSVWTEWGNWIGNKASAATDAVGSAHESGERQMGQTVDTTTKAAKDTSAEAPSRAAPMRCSRLPSAKPRTKQYALQKAAEARAAAKRTYDAAAKVASDAANAAQRRAHDLAEYARRQAHAAGNAIDRRVDASTAAGRDAAAASRKANEVRDDAHRQYGRGINRIKRQANDWF